MKEEPKCPYCGDRMEIRVSLTTPDWGLLSAQYKCMTCESTSPRIEFSGGTSNEKIIERLQAVSSRRAEPENRVLTLEEVQNLDYVDYEQQHILSAEYKSIIRQAENVFSPCVVCHESLSQIGVLELYDGAAMKLREKSGYGKYWRCWLRKPTEAERRETPWES